MNQENNIDNLFVIILRTYFYSKLKKKKNLPGRASFIFLIKEKAGIRKIFTLVYFFYIYNIFTLVYFTHNRN